MHVKMSVIAKISSYFERSVVTLKLRKEYLNTVTYNTSVLLQIKYWTVWYTERYSMSTYTEVSNFQKTVRFFDPPCTLNVCPRWTFNLDRHEHNVSDFCQTFDKLVLVDKGQSLRTRFQEFAKCGQSIIYCCWTTSMEQLALPYMYIAYVWFWIHTTGIPLAAEDAPV